MSREDLDRAFDQYGKSETLRCLARLIIENYDFPYERACEPRVSPPSFLELPKLDCKATPAPSTMLLGGYRCSRLPTGPDTVRIPGITLILHDDLSRPDWILDSYMEQHRMKCWVAVQGKPRRWADTRNDLRSPHARLTNHDELMKVLEGIALSHPTKDAISHDDLRNAVVGHGEALPPTVEFYLQMIAKLTPTSIRVERTTYGVSLAALACVAGTDIEYSFQMSGLEEPACRSLRKYIASTGVSPEELFETSREEDLQTIDLIIMDIIPYGTHDLRAYQGEQSTPRYNTYSQHIHRTIIDPLKDILKREPSRIALVTSLRELHALPTIEPVLLTIMSDPELAGRLEIVGALISQKRDYAVFLIRVTAGGSSEGGSPELSAGATKEDLPWGKMLHELYPELDGKPGEPDVIRKKDTGKLSSAASESIIKWDDLCLRKFLATEPPESVLKIPMQGSRKGERREIFPKRTRRCTVMQETLHPESKDVIFVFGEVVKEAPIVAPIGKSTLLSRMADSIKANTASEQS